MKLTNDANLPLPLVNAVAFDNRNRGNSEFTVSELIEPPRIGALKRLHDADITEDASDRLWLLIGSATHEILRRSATTGIVEERCFVELDGCKVSGQPDYAIGDDVLWDFKVTSVWAVKDGPKPEFIQQLNAYRFLLNAYGVEINSLKICAILRDWSLPESKRSNGDYPKQQVKVMELPLWEFAATEAWLKQRIALHRAARAGNLPECTSVETWEKPTRFAAIKKGGKRATKVFDTAAECITFAQENSLEVEKRPGERPRCESYCPVSDFCETFKAWKTLNQPTT